MSIASICAILVLASGNASGAQAHTNARPGKAAVSIIIDDLGYRRPEGLRAIELPGPIAFAVLPHTPYGKRLAELAHRLDKEVILHLPMEGNPEKELGPGGLITGMTRSDIESVLDAALGAVPHASGLNNHMGSVLTADPDAMGLLMGLLRARRPLFFVDSVTTARSVAFRAAREVGVDATRRDVFLDSEIDPRIIRRQFMRLVAMARANGTALGIGHPYPETLDVLGRLLPRSGQFGVEMVTVTELIGRRGSLTPPERRPRTIHPRWPSAPSFSPTKAVH